MTRTTADIELYIEELVLHGFDPGAREAIASEVQAELERRLALELAMPGEIAGGALERIDAGSVRVASADRPRAIGTQIGGAIAGAIAPAWRAR